MGYRIHSTQGKRQRESHDRPPAGPPAPGAAVRPAARPAVTAVQPTGTSVLRHTALPVGADVPRGPTHLGHLGPPVRVPRRVRRPVVPGSADHLRDIQGPRRLRPGPLGGGPELPADHVELLISVPLMLVLIGFVTFAAIG